MNRHKIDEIAGHVADDASVDWETYEGDDALGSVLPAFRLIASVAGAFRDAGATSPERAPDFRWGPFDVFERLGSGGFGDVFRAHDPRLARDVALKLRHAVVGDELTTSRLFLDEARRLARVRHPNVVVIHGADIHDGRVGLWTDLVSGPSLETRLAEEGAFAAPDAARMGAALARALHAIHDAGFIHGDVKPGNVLFEGDDVRLIDFGAGRDRTLDAPQLVGSPAYVAPEVLEGDAPTPASDQYALGVLVAEALSGELPPDARRDDALATLREARDTPLALVAVIERALASRTTRRYASAAAFADALEGAATPPRHVPAFLTTFIGRRRELGHVSRAADTHRLVTLLGAGGMGKTRLAAEWVTHASAPDGVFWVDLAPLSSDSVPSGIQRATGAGPSELPELDAAIAFFAPRRSLLVLDNAEHVLDAVRTASKRLLSACPSLRIVVTSREATRVSGEGIVDVGPLDMDVDEDASRLFVDRAQQLLPSFTPDESTRRLVRDVCVRLDGVPLAIELAAARVRAFELKDLLARLGANVLTDPARAERHASIEAMVRWSVDLASDAERRLLRRASVFAGSWSLDTIERVCADDALPLSELTLAHSGLVDKSLVTARDGAGGRRYHLLQIVRDVAAAELPERETLAVRRRQREVLNDLLISHRTTLLTGDPTIPLRTFEYERPNLLDVLEWFATRRLDLEDTGLLMNSATRYWDRLATWPEPERIARLILGDDPLDRFRSRKWASFLTAAANPYLNLRRYDRNREILEAVLEIYRELAHGEGVATVLSNLAGNAMDTGDLERAEQFIEDAIRAARAIDNPRRICLALTNASAIADRQGDLERAWTLGEEAIAACRQLGDNALLAHLLINRGRGEHCRGRIESAREAFEEALIAADVAREPQMTVLGTCDLIRTEWSPPTWEPLLERLASVASLADSLGNDLAVADVLHARAEVDVRRGAEADAQRSVRQLLQYALDTRFESYVEPAATIVGLLALARGDAAFGAWCFGAAEGVAERHSHGGAHTPPERERLEGGRRTAASRLTPDAYEAERRRGAETAWDDVARTALRRLESWR